MDGWIKEAITSGQLEQVGLGKGVFFPEVVTDPDRMASQLPFLASEEQSTTDFGTEGIGGQNHNVPGDLHPGE